MSEDQILKCLIAFVLGFLVARMMRGNGFMEGARRRRRGQKNDWPQCQIEAPSCRNLIAKNQDSITGNTEDINNNISNIENNINSIKKHKDLIEQLQQKIASCCHNKEKK